MDKVTLRKAVMVLESKLESLDMNKLGVFGHGVLGSVIAQVARSAKFDVIIYDPFKPEVHERDLAFISHIAFVCVPTPTVNGEQDLKPLLHVLDKMKEYGYSGVIVIKCTILPGTTKELKKLYPSLRLCHSPEFLTAKHAHDDFAAQSAILISGSDMDLKTLDLVFGRLLPGTEIIKTNNTDETELAKYMHNCFLATKVGFFNDMYEVSQKIEVSYDKVLDMALSQDQIHSNHTSVPHVEVNGGKKKFGFGGYCFPKDVQALLTWSQRLGLEMKQLEATSAANGKRRPEWKC